MKPHFRRSDQSSGIVDEAHGPQRRCLVVAAPPDVEPFEKVYGRTQQRRCDCRHRARGGRAGRSGRRYPQARSPRSGLRPTTTDDSVIKPAMHRSYQDN